MRLPRCFYRMLRVVSDGLEPRPHDLVAIQYALKLDVDQLHCILELSRSSQGDFVAMCHTSS